MKMFKWDWQENKKESEHLVDDSLDLPVAKIDWKRFDLGLVTIFPDMNERLENRLKLTFSYFYSKDVHITNSSLDLPIFSVDVKTSLDICSNTLPRPGGFRITISRYIENKVNENV